MLAVLNPVLVLIDHGHFQYNTVALGLTIFAIILYKKEQYFFGSVLYVLAINFKQISLYYSLTFFSFIIGKSLSSRNPYLIVSCASAVLLTQFLLLLPWLSSSADFLSLMHNIFPIHRGLYQLKVSSFWCISEPIFKYQLRFSQEFLVQLTSVVTVASSIPPMV
jgi:alpha-1,3-glucosyltransferase